MFLTHREVIMMIFGPLKDVLMLLIHSGCF